MKFVFKDKLLKNKPALLIVVLALQIVYALVHSSAPAAPAKYHIEATYQGATTAKLLLDKK